MELNVFAVFLAALIGAGLVFAWLQRCPAIRRRVLLNLKSEPDNATEGILWGQRGPWLILRDVSVYRSDGKTSKFDGDMIVDRANVTWIQVISEG
jgi:hypothetical protein